MISRVFALFILILFVNFSFALEPIDTDGPDFVESSEVVPLGYFQYEFDVGSNKSSRSGSTLAEFNSPLLIRYGFSENWELRIASDGYIHRDKEDGFGNTSFGLKYHSLDKDPNRALPSISWIAHFQTPIASPAFKNNAILPSFRSVLTWELPSDLALGLMPGIASQINEANQTYTAGIFGAVLNKRLSSNARVFVELSIPTLSKSSENGVVQSADIGSAYLVNNDLQAGFRAGYGLNSNSPKNYFLFEIDQRFN